MNNAINTLHEELRILSPRLEKRRSIFQKWLIAGVIALSIIATIYLFPDRHSLPYPVATIVFVALIPSSILYLILNHFYRKGGKNILVKRLEEVTGLTYNPAGVFPIDISAKHKILPSHDQSTMEDGFEGEYNGTPIALQEIKLDDLEQDPNHRDRRREMTVFWGLLVRIKLKRFLEAHTVIVPRNAVQTFFRTQFSTFQKVKLVSSKFEKMYDVMGTDQVEARVILNPSFMEHVMDIKRLLKARWIDASFYQDEILFAIQRFKPLFEFAPLWKPVNTPELQKFADELESVMKLVDVLKKNRQINI